MTEKEQQYREPLNEQEVRLLQMIRRMKFGEIRIFITEGKPVRAEEIKKSIKL
jgi:Holliday junction resolvase-like predicted endonuclease